MRHRSLVLQLFVSSAMLCASAQPQPPLSGQWEGVVQIPGEQLRVVIDLEQKGQQWVGSYTAPQFAIKGAPLSGIAVNENNVEFTLRGGATVNARIETDGLLKGEYHQGGNTAPVLLKRAGDARVDFPEPSDPIGKDLVGEWKGNFSLLNSTVHVMFTLPNSGTAMAPAGELLVIDWGNAKMPIKLWKQDGSKFFALLGDDGWSYEGELHKDASEITGTLRISFLEIPLALHPGAANTAAPDNTATHPATK